MAEQTNFDFTANAFLLTITFKGYKFFLMMKLMQIYMKNLNSLLYER